MWKVIMISVMINLLYQCLIHFLISISKIEWISANAILIEITKIAFSKLSNVTVQWQFKQV